MTDRIKELEKQLAQARTEEATKEGFTVVIFEDDLESLKEIKVKPHELTEKEKANIMQFAGKLGDNLNEIKEIAEKLDTTVGPWLKLMALIDDPLKEIISSMFDLEVDTVATIPNIDLLGLIFEDNPWINSKAKNLAKELDFISNKNK